MQETQQEPLHWDSHRTNLNLTLIFSLVVAVIGIMGQPLLFVIGVGVAIYSWLTTPRQYLIYSDALVLVYGRPRVKSYPFQEIANLELLTLPIGDRLRVRMANGRRLMLLTKDTETFRAQLDEALAAFHGSQQGTDYDQETRSETPPHISIGVQPGVEPTPPTDIPSGEGTSKDDEVPY